MKITNPFLLTGYISPDLFCNRENETEHLKKSAINSINTAIFSIRRMGKTGLLHHVIRELKKEKIKCVYFDIMMTHSINEFTYEFAKAFFNQAADIPQKILTTARKMLRSFSPSIISDPNTGNLSVELKLIRNEPAYGDLDGILNYIKNSEQKYFIVIDEFQQILNYGEQNFEAYLRSHIQYLNNTSFAFSGSKKNMLLSIFGDYSKPLWQSCNFIELKQIDKLVYSDFIIEKYYRHSKKITQEALDLIFQVTRGITYFVQLFCNYLFNTQQKNIDIYLTNEVLNNIISERESYYINYINLLTKKNIELLYAIANESEVSQPFGKDFVMKYRLGSTSTIKSTIDVLSDKEIIYREEGMYMIADPLFSEWLKRNGSNLFVN